MRKTALILAVTIAVPNGSTYGQPGTGPNAFSDLVPICDAYSELDVVFLVRAQAPITLRISEAAKVATEHARQEFINVEREVTRLRASLDPRTQLERELEFVRRLEHANAEFERRQADYRDMDDLIFFPVIVEQTLRGVTEATLMLRLADPSMSLEPGELYVIGGRRSRDAIPPFPEIASRLPFVEYVDAGRLTPAGMATQELRFLTTTLQGATILGDLRSHSYGAVGAPLPGVRILVSSDVQTLETVTREDGSFIVSGIEPGPVVVTPLLPRDLAVVNKSQLAFAFRESWCKPLPLTVELNGQIRGRILAANDKLLDTAKLTLRTVHGDDFRLVSSHSFQTSTRPNEDGTFEFSGVPPGSYLLAAVLERTEDGKTRYLVTYFPGTSDIAAAVPILVDRASQHDGIDFLVVTD